MFDQVFDCDKYANDVEMAALYAIKAADRVRRYKDKQQGEDSVGRMTMAGADELYVRLHGSAAKLAAAMDELSKARTEAALANGEGAWGIGVAAEKAARLFVEKAAEKAADREADAAIDREAEDRLRNA